MLAGAFDEDASAWDSALENIELLIKLPGICAAADDDGRAEAAVDALDVDGVVGVCCCGSRCAIFNSEFRDADPA